MAQRKKVSRKGSRQLFTAVGNRTQSINLQQPPHIVTGKQIGRAHV